MLRPAHSRTTLLRWLLAGLALMTSASGATADTTYTVGEDPFTCDYTDLQQAIDDISLASGPNRLLRVMEGVFLGAHLVIDQALIIEGGYRSCTESDPSASSPLLKGNGAEPVIRIDGSGTGQVILRNLDLQDGASGLRISGNSNVLLDNVFIFNNDAGTDSGGGIYMTGSGVRVEIVDSYVIGNYAFSGAGIHCGGRADLRLRGLNFVSENETTGGPGGGIAAVGCSLEAVGTYLAENYARSGAGIYADGSSTATSIRLRRTTLEMNEVVAGAELRRGGGLLISGGGATLDASDTRFRGNKIAFGLSCGGGVAVINGAKAVLSSSSECGATGPCSELSGNEAHDGAAACVSRETSAGSLVIAGTRVEGNVSFGAGRSSTLYSSDGADLAVEGTVLTGNEAVALVHADGGAATLGFVTIAGNRVGEVLTAVDGGVWASSAALYSSIVWENPTVETFVGDLGVSLGAGCLLVHETATVPTGAPHITELIGDPGFVDAVAGDFHLSAGSPAIDFCDTSPYVPFSYDIDLGIRGINAAIYPDNFPGAFFDIGADEVGSTSRISRDGFEAGDLSTWSSSVP